MENNDQKNLQPLPLPPITPPNPVEPEWYQHKGLISIIILAVIAGVAVWIYFNLNQPKDLGPVVVDHQLKNIQSDLKTNSPAESISTKTSQAIDYTPSDTTNWQSYTDNALGIKIKFPKDWHSLGNGTVSDMSNEQLNQPGMYGKAAIFRVALRAYKNISPINEWYGQYFVSNPLKGIVSKMQTTVGGLPAIEVLSKNNYTGTEWGTANYFVANGGHIFDINFGINDQKLLDTYKTILANVEFFDLKTLPIGSYEVSTNNLVSSSITNSKIIEQGFESSFNSILTPTGSSVNGETYLLSPSGEKFLIADQAKQNFDSVGLMPISPSNKDVILISRATEMNWDKEIGDVSYCKAVNKIYSYNLKTGDITELYSEISENNSPMDKNNCRKLNAVGTQGSRLILVTDDPEDSPGPCTDIWADFAKQFVYLELSDIQKGLQKFTVPQKQIDEGKTRGQQCQRELVD